MFVYFKTTLYSRRTKVETGKQPKDTIKVQLRDIIIWTMMEDEGVEKRNKFKGHFVNRITDFAS